jgi:hypothetical protein
MVRPRSSVIVLLACVAAYGPAASAANPQGFSYQGRLTNGGVPANGVCDVTFTLYGVPSGGSPATAPVPQTVNTVNGLFTTTVEFGVSAFYGNATPPPYYVDLQVRCPSGAGPFVELSPRQPFTATVAQGEQYGGIFTATGPTSPSVGVLGIGNYDGVVGSSTTGFAMLADGPTRQLRGKGGWVKALANVHGSALSRCFRGDETTTPSNVDSCAGWAISGTGGETTITFPFNAGDRYVSVTPEFAGAGTPVFVSYDFPAVNQVRVRTWTCATGVTYTPCVHVDSAYSIVVY